MRFAESAGREEQPRIFRLRSPWRPALKVTVIFLYREAVGRLIEDRLLSFPYVDHR
jgi:hypothetical protein